MTNDTLETPIFCKNCNRTLADHTRLELILCAIQLTEVVKTWKESKNLDDSAPSFKDCWLIKLSRMNFFLRLS